jgi:SAM-dependent methyltransferase
MKQTVKIFRHNRPKAMTAEGVHPKVLSLLSSETKGKTLDLGAGQGALSYELKKLGFDVTAADLSRDFMLEDVKFVLADLNHGIPFKSGSFDLVCAVEILEHLDNPHFLIKEIHRVLKHRGKCIITTPNLEQICSRFYFLASGRFSYFSPRDVAELGHVTPIFLWNFDRFIKRLFTKESVTFNKGAFIPFLARTVRIRFPFLNKLTGEIWIMKLVKVD